MKFITITKHYRIKDRKWMYIVIEKKNKKNILGFIDWVNNRFEFLPWNENTKQLNEHVYNEILKQVGMLNENSR